MDPVSKAQLEHGSNTASNTAGLRPPWKPGQSGNPNGRPKKTYITKMMERVLRKSANRKEIEESMMKILRGGRMATVLLLREMGERTEGKVVQAVEVTGTVNTMSDEELLKRLESLFGLQDEPKSDPIPTP